MPDLEHRFPLLFTGEMLSISVRRNSVEDSMVRISSVQGGKLVQLALHLKISSAGSPSRVAEERERDGDRHVEEER